MTGSSEPRLPPGYRLDRSDPYLWTLRLPEGWVAAYFSARGITEEVIEEASWEDYESDEEDWGDGEDTRLHLLLPRVLVRRGSGPLSFIGPYRKMVSEELRVARYGRPGPRTSGAFVAFIAYVATLLAE